MDQNTDVVTDQSTNVVNNKNANQVKNLVSYRGVYISFTETNQLTGEVKEGKFKLFDGFDAKVYSADKYVVVVLADGSKGTAKCEESDTFSFKNGLHIAFNRALVDHIKKETKKLYGTKKTVVKTA
jgi:hypothetical protein